MLLDHDFTAAAGDQSKRKARVRPAPFCLRLSDAERTQLANEAAGAPLGT